MEIGLKSVLNNLLTYVLDNKIYVKVFYLNNTLP